MREIIHAANFVSWICENISIKAFEYGLEYCVQAIVRDCEGCYDDDSIIAMIEANDYEFLEDGSLAWNL